MLKITLADLREHLEKQGYHPLTPILLIFITVALIIPLMSKIDFDKIPCPSWIIYISSIVIISLVILIIWLFKTRVPKAPDNRVCLLIALNTETIGQRQKISHDFVEALRELLSKSSHPYRFAIIELPQYYSAKINDIESATKYIVKSRCHFMIYGRASLGKVKGSEYHALKLEGIVRHALIPIETSHKLSQEFKELFPKKLLLSSENDLLAFEFTSEWINIIARYIIGIASLVSGDIKYAESLFEDLQTKISHIGSPNPAIIKIKQRLPSRLLDVYISYSSFMHEEWRLTRDIQLLEKIKQYLDKIEALDPNNYELHLLLSIRYFVLDRDIKKAMKELNKCKHQRDATWKYSKAFLLAYQGDIQRAERIYKDAFNGPVGPKTLIEIEEFIDWILEQEPDKIQLYYCLGLFNYHGKGDKEQSFKDFEKFVKAAQNHRFTHEVTKAMDYLKKIKTEITI